jgi:(p)ppGpp synthase/HD superfamily hydrolase
MAKSAFEIARTIAREKTRRLRRIIRQREERRREEEMETPTRAIEARNFATFAHEGQKYGDKPYTVHLEQVADLARPFGDEAQVAAWLHDVLEDTDTTEEQLQELFGRPTAAVVKFLSDPPGRNRKTRKALLYERLARFSEFAEEGIVLLVKLCDRLANVRNCVATNNQGLLKMYRREHPTFRVAVYRKGSQPEDYWNELDQLLEVPPPCLPNCS